VWVGVGLAAFQQLVGINVVFYYGAVLWQAVGFSEADSLKINILSGSLSIAACVAAIFMIDRVGRKAVVADRIHRHGRDARHPDRRICDGIWSTVPCTCAEHRQTRAHQRESLCGLLQPELGTGHVGDARRDVPESNPRLRPRGERRGAMEHQLSHQREFPVLAKYIGLPITYGIYAACAFLSIFFVLKMVHETRGRELEDMVG
jgi:SP family sugar:H+ symporter-like MFS transporter